MTIKNIAQKVGKELTRERHNDFLDTYLGATYLSIGTCLPIKSRASSYFINKAIKYDWHSDNNSKFLGLAFQGITMMPIVLPAAIKLRRVNNYLMGAHKIINLSCPFSEEDLEKFLETE
jgi:hypothetical protein